MVAVTLGASALPAQEKEADAKPPADALTVMKMLEQTIHVKDFQEPRKLKKAIEILSEVTGGRPSIWVDQRAFLTDEAPMDPYDLDVVLPDHPTKMTVQQAIRSICSQLDREPATFLIKNGGIVIVPARHATSKSLLRAPVLVSFDRRPFDAVLRELSDHSGLTIILDPSVGKKANTEISATFRNATLEDALVAVTEMAELKFAVLHQSIYVTTASKAETMEKEEAARSKKREPALPRIVPAPAG
jgi:hypothetical protein